MDPQPTAFQRKRLLVIDDDRDYADAMCELLRLTCAWDVDVAYGPEDALSQARSHPPDAVLMDLRMPRMDGFETATRLCEAQREHLPSLIALTGDAQLCREAAEDGRFCEALLKPLDTLRLLGLLARHAIAGSAPRPPGRG